MNCGAQHSAGSGRPIAVNVDPTESDLSHLDPQDNRSGSHGRARPDTSRQ